jgi:flagellar M-ring protein FliF
MEVLKRSWLQVRHWMDGLSRAERGLIVCVMIISVAALAGIVWYLSSPERVPIGRYGVRSAEVAGRLQAAGYDAVVDGPTVRVPRGQRDEVLVTLATQDLLTEDSLDAFDEMIEKQSPWSTEPQNKRALLIAKGKALGRVIGKMRGVRSADVLISMPEDRGFGVAYTPPSASVSIQPDGAGSVRAIKDAVANLVAGAVAEMSPQDVAVIDMSTGRQHRVGDEHDALPTEQLELKQALQERKRKEIEFALSYIQPRAIVAVNILTDTIQSQSERSIDYSDSEPLESERSMEEVNATRQDAGEPGVRSNAGLDINGGSQAGTESTRTEREATYRPKDIVRETHTTRRGMATQTVNVTVNVPRGYFVSLWRAENPPAEGDDAVGMPLDADLEPIRQRELTKIEDQVRPLIAAASQGTIVAHMVPDETVMPALASLGPTGTLDQLIGSGWVAPGSVALMALLSLALMLGMVRKATRPESLPSVEELAGVPPTLPDDDDELVGEVDEQESSLEGVELDEDELRSRRISEQIGEMIKSNPDEAGRIMKRWVTADEY